MDDATKYAQVRLSVLAKGGALGAYEADLLLDDVRLVCAALETIQREQKETHHTLAIVHQGQQEMRRRVGHFAGQLEAWGYADAAQQVRTEILTGPVEVDGEYNALLAEVSTLRAALARTEGMNTEMCAALEMAWELDDCATVAAQEGTATVDAARANARRNAILEQIYALLKHAREA